MKQGTPGFNGERLKLACDIRGVNIAGLQGMIEISRQMISLYMSGEKTPAPETFNKIADKLNFPKEFFLRNSIAENSSPVFYRSMSYTTKIQRTSARGRYIVLKEIFAFLEQYIDPVYLSFPDFEIKDPYKLTENDIDSFANQVRKLWNLNYGPISNITQLLENKGVIMTGFQMDAEGLNAFSEWDDITGRPFIILNFDKSDIKAVRMRFNAAHELGHLLFHSNVDKNDLTNSTKFKIQENQVNRFASSFLLPESTFPIEVKWPTLDNFVDLKKRWKVSIQAMIMRCEQLGIITEHQKTNLFINISKRHWRMEEPLDDIIKTEKPLFLYKAFKLILNEVLSVDELLHQLCYFPIDIQEIACLPENMLHKKEIYDIMEIRRKKDNF